MKRIHYYFVLVTIFLVSSAFQCEDELDDYGCNSTTFTTEKIPIKIDRTTNLKVNDTIWISISINKELKDLNGEALKLNMDDFDYLRQYFGTELKNSFNEYSSLNFGAFFVEKTGTVVTDNGSVSHNFIFDTTLNSYNSSFGLILKEKGTYRFSTWNLYQNNYSTSCLETSFEIPLFFENGTVDNDQIYTFTVD